VLVVATFCPARDQLATRVTAQTLKRSLAASLPTFAKQGEKFYENP
jgi:hypothetical protein